MNWSEGLNAGLKNSGGLWKLILTSELLIRAQTSKLEDPAIALRQTFPSQKL